MVGQIKTVEELERLAGLKVPKEEREELQEVLEKYPAKFTGHLLALMKKSGPVARQFLPNKIELATYGTIAPFEEGLHASEIYGVERLYTDRAIITLTFNCPAYCRFCFRKSRVLRNKPEMSIEDIDMAVAFVEKEKELKGILITGGDPFVCPDKLLYLIEKLKGIEHLMLIRIGTRSFLYQPEKLTEELAKKLAAAIQTNPENPSKSKTLSIVTHFNHPDEISPESVKAIQRFAKQGIILRNQTVLLKGVNDDFETMRQLFETLVANNVVPYQLFHCTPLKGIKHLRTTVQKGIDILKELYKLSGIITPHYAILTPIGKIKLIHSNKLEYKTKNGERYVVLKSPYAATDFLKNTNQKKLPENCYSDKDGLITAEYLDGE